MRLRIFAKNIKHNAIYILFVFLVTSLASSTLSTFVLTTESAKLRVIESTAKAYGSYHVILADIDNKALEILSQQDYIETYSGFFVQYDSNMDFYYSSADLVSLLGNYITVGDFPSNQNDIMLEKNYVLSRYGADYEQLIGEAIIIGDETFILSGIFQDQSLSSINRCFLQIDKEHSVNNVAILFKDGVNIDKAISKLAEAMNGYSDENIIKNIPLYSALGYGEDGQRQTAINTTIIIILASILFFITGIIVNNVMDICLNHNLKAISIYKLLCNSSRYFIIQLLAPLFVVMIYGISFGYFIAQNVLLHGVVEFTNKTARGTNLFWEYCIPLYVFILTLSVLYIFIKNRKLNRMSDISVCKNSKLICINYDIIQKKNKIVFKGPSLIKGRFKFYISAANSSILKNITIVIGLSFSIVIGVLLLYMGTDTNDYSYNYDYQLIANSYDYMDKSISETNQLTIDRLKAARNECMVIEQRQVHTHLNIDKSLITSNYKNLLVKYSQYGNRVRDNFNNQINLPAVVIGYSDDTLTKLGVDSDFDHKRDCIVFNASASHYGVDNIFNSNLENTIILKYDLFTDESVAAEGYQINIDKYTDKIMYPVSYSVDTLVLIISNELFDALYPDTPITNYYIVATDAQDARKSIEDIIGGSTSMQVIDQEETNLENERNRHIAKVVFGILFLIVIAFSFVNIYSIFSLNFRKYIDVYVSYMAIGVRRSQLFVTFIINAIKYIVLSIPISYCILLFAIYLIRELFYSYQAEYYVAFPLLEYLSFVGLVVVLLSITLLFVFHKFKLLKVGAHSISAD